MDRRRWLVVWLVSALLLVVGALLVVPLLVRQRAAAAANARGFELEIGEVKLRPTRIWLVNVHLVHQRVPGLELRLPSVELRIGLWDPHAVIIHGGDVAINAELDQLRTELGRGTQSSAEHGEPSASGASLEARALNLRARLGAGEQVFASGIHAKRDGSKLELSAELLRALRPGLELELTQVQARVERAHLVLESFGAASTRARLLLKKAESDPEPEPTPTPPAPTRQKPAAPTPQKQGPAVPGPLALDPMRGERWIERLRQLSGLVGRRLPEQSSFALGEVYVALVYDAATLNLGPARVTGAREADELHVSAALAAGPASETPLEISLSLPLAAGAVKLSAKGGPVSLSQLGVREGDWGLLAVDHARVSVDTALELAADGRHLSSSSKGEVSSITWSQRRVASEPLRDLAFTWNGRGQLALDGSLLEVKDAEFGFGAVRMSGQARLEQSTERLTIDGKLSVSRASCQEMFESLPVALVPLLQGVQFRGMFSWNAALKLDTSAIADSDVSWRMQNGCVIERIPPAIDPEQFFAPFVRTVIDAEGQPRQLQSGPGTPDWVAFNQVSHFLESAVLTTEDGGFWNHRGFDQGAIEGSIRSNLEAGRFVRGASTISMQLAKNLYLSREKLLSRKIQEALLTMLLEQELRKPEILELYFNVIELGPDIYGIGPAADYYFNSNPAELSLSQAFYLASILPNPRVSHFEPTGELTPAWSELLQRLMKLAEQRQRISKDELEQGLSEQVRWGVPNLVADEAEAEGGATEGTDPTAGP